MTTFRVDPPKTNSEIAPRAALLAAAATAAGCANNLLVLLNRQQHEAHPADPSIQEIIGSARALVVELTIAAREAPTER